jgi:hypothetical protein
VLKQIVELNRKLMSNLNTDTPTNFTFRDDPVNDNSQRVYFLANNYITRENTLKFIDIKRVGHDRRGEESLNGQQLLSDYSAMLTTGEKTALTKEEQLLRERQRCSNTGVTSYFLDPSSRRLLFSDRSELFYYDDDLTSAKNVL